MPFALAVHFTGDLFGRFGMRVVQELRLFFGAGTFAGLDKIAVFEYLTR